VEIAARHADATIVFVDLAPIADPDAVVGALTAALGIAVSEGADGAVRSLNATPGLLILDNCEHLVDAVSDLAQEVVRRCPASKVVATSREPLAVDGEVVWRVPPLADAAGVDLFLERALAVRPDLVVDESIDAARGIVRRLDGLPLAVELAAARASHLSVPEIASHLDARFELLVGGRRKARPRQQTLEATIDWSYNLLGPVEQAVLRASSVFVNGFTLDALAHVADLRRTTALDVLGSLVEKSLVMAEQTARSSTRYRLLESLRLYAQDRLISAGEALSCRDRHAQWFATLARADRGVSVADWTVDVADGDAIDSRDHDNVVSALEWCEDHGDLASVGWLAYDAMRKSIGYEHAHDGRRYLHREDVLRAMPERDRAFYLIACASSANGVGDYELQSSCCERALALVGDQEIRLLVLLHLSVAKLVTDPDAAERVADEALALTRPGSGLAREVMGLKASAALMRGDLESALAIWEGAGTGGFTATEQASALHILGRHDDVRALLDAAAGLPERWYSFRFSMMAALEHAAAQEIGPAYDDLSEAAHAVDRRPRLLFDRDLLIAAAGVAYLQDDPFRCATLLAVEEETLATRSPGTWRLYLHYRALARARLSTGDVGRARRAARSLTVQGALAEELRRAGDRTAATV
jgi:predicted ATPase